MTYQNTNNVPYQRSYPVTILLIVICIVFYPMALQSDRYYCSYDTIYVQGRWWTAVTAVFMHGSLSHLLFNMIFLLSFGSGLEKMIGSHRFLPVYLAGGAISMCISVLYYPHNQPSLGASGAICTVLAALMLFNPWRLSFLLFLVPMPLGVAGFTFLLMNIAGFYIDYHHPPTGGMQTSYAGHLAGFFIGVIFGIMLSPAWKRNLLTSILQFVVYYIILVAIFHFVRI